MGVREGTACKKSRLCPQTDSLPGGAQANSHHRSQLLRKEPPGVDRCQSVNMALTHSCRGEEPWEEGLCLRGGSANPSDGPDSFPPGTGCTSPVRWDFPGGGSMAAQLS